MAKGKKQETTKTKGKGNFAKVPRLPEIQSLSPEEVKKPIATTMPDNGQNGIFALETRRRRVAALYLGGWTQIEIAHDVGVSIGTINNDLEVLQRLWRDRAVEDIDKAKMREIAKVDNLERLATEAYIRSMGIEEIHTESDKTFGEGSSNERKVVRKQLIGDKGFLQQIENCIKLRCQIMGITDDKKTNVNLFNVNWQEIAGSGSGAEEIENAIRVIESGRENETNRVQLPHSKSTISTDKSTDSDEDDE